jgi:hypothetical protein
MRDWVFMLGPAALLFYFLFNPDQFTAFAYWVEHLIR